MSLTLRTWAALGVALVLAAATATPAWAGQGTSLLRFGLRADGYRVELGARGATAALDVIRDERARHAGAITTYFARARLHPSSVRASFGALGSVSMRFRPSGRVTYGRPGRDCRKPSRVTTRSGVFVGSLRFRGEGGYVSVHIHRARGEVISPAPHDCPKLGWEALAPGRSRVTRLAVGRRRGLDATYFFARAKGRAFYYAFVEAGGEQVAVSHAAFARAAPRTFLSDGALSFASVSPPYPFSGTGSIQRRPSGSRTWAGSLAASFPGDPDVPLTGPGFKTRLTRSW